MHGYRSLQCRQLQGATAVCRGDRQDLGAYTPGDWYSLTQNRGQNCPAVKSINRGLAAVTTRGTKSFPSAAGNSHSEHGSRDTRHDCRTRGQEQAEAIRGATEFLALGERGW